MAVIEIVSPGNKAARSALRSLVEKAADLLRRGVHLLIVDLLPPTPRDPQGIHKVLWDEIEEAPFALPPDKPRTLAAYSAGGPGAAGAPVRAYVEPAAVGDTLPTMPLFLEADRHVLLPLERTYVDTWARCPGPFRRAVAGP